MRLGTKKRLLALMLSVLTIWPIIHMALVEQCGINAWKLAGWGMYSAPQMRPRIQIDILQNTRWITARSEHITQELREVIHEFALNCTTLGRLCTPASLGEAFLAEWPSLDGVRVIVTRFVLNTATGRLEAEEDRHEYSR